MPVSNDPGPDPSRRRQSTCLRRTERPSARYRIFSTSRACCMSMVKPALNSSRPVAISFLPPAGRHTRRKFYDVVEATGSPVATEALRRIGEIYAVEADVRGQSPALRLAARLQRSKPVVAAFHTWLEVQLQHISGRSTLAEAIRYALSRWTGLTRFLTDGRVELDTNPVERAIRPVALGRKNHLFAGRDGGGGRWAIVCSLIETAKLSDVEPYAYLADVVQHARRASRQRPRRTPAMGVESAKSRQELTSRAAPGRIRRFVSVRS